MIDDRDARYKLHRDERPGWLYAYGCAKRYWKWLLDRLPEDSRQVISLACTIDPIIGRQLARIVNSGMRDLAVANGYRLLKTQDGVRWLGDLNMTPTIERNHGLDVMPFRSAHGRISHYKSGCRCEECKKAMSVYYQRNRDRIRNQQNRRHRENKQLSCGV